MTEMNKNTLSSELTKEKLVNEGIKQFALYGINGVRTRQLAESAGLINPLSLIIWEGSWVSMQLLFVRLQQIWLK